MNKTFEFFLGILTGAVLTLLIGIASHNDKNARITKLEKQQAQLIEMLTYIPEQDIPDMVETTRPKVIGKGADK